MDLTEKQLDEVIQEVNRRCPESAKRPDHRVAGEEDPQP